MDEEKAVKTLASLLAKHLGSQVVQDQTYKNKFTKDAFYVVQFSEPFIIGYDQFYMKNPDSDGNKYRFGFVNTERTKKQYHSIYDTIQDTVDAEEKYKGANYFFASEPVQEKDRGVHIFITPYSIIGKKEAQKLRHLLYKNVQPDIMSAMHTLKITDYTGLYKIYSSRSMEGSFLESYYACLRIENMLTKLDFERFDSNIIQSRIEALLGMKIEEFNKKLDKNVRHIILYDPYSKGEERFATKANLEHTKNEIQTYSAFGKWVSFLPDFLNLVFTLPLEDQNIETNKKILSLLASETIDYIGILSKEYSKGKHFKEYFTCLDDKRQENLVDSLKTLQERNPVNDSFLWSKGFKNIGMDYLKIYKEDPDTFIDYFSSRSLEEKKVIIKDIMESEHTNEKVINWLNEKEADLIREVGFDG